MYNPFISLVGTTCSSVFSYYIRNCIILLLLLLAVVFFFSNIIIVSLLCVCVGSKLSVTDIHNGETYVTTGSKSFCYDNSIAPNWRHTWTTIQVAHIHCASLFNLFWHSFNNSLKFSLQYLLYLFINLNCYSLWFVG